MHLNTFSDVPSCCQCPITESFFNVNVLREVLTPCELQNTSDPLPSTPIVLKSKPLVNVFSRLFGNCIWLLPKGSTERASVWVPLHQVYETACTPGFLLYNQDGYPCNKMRLPRYEMSGCTGIMPFSPILRHTRQTCCVSASIETTIRIGRGGFILILWLFRYLEDAKMHGMLNAVGQE